VLKIEFDPLDDVPPPETLGAPAPTVMEYDVETATGNPEAVLRPTAPPPPGASWWS
jgi:hypothetical protein